MGHAVALIGPDEPEDFSRHTGVFGSHYDEGRITRRFDPEPFWVQMNGAAISRYDEISGESGVEFYREAGVLHVGDAENPNVAHPGHPRGAYSKSSSPVSCGRLLSSSSVACE
jgi:sarcosine oxidase